MSNSEKLFSPAFRERFVVRFEELQMELADPDIFQDNLRYVQLSKEHARLLEINSAFFSWDQCRKSVDEAKSLLDSSCNDLEMESFFRGELQSAESSLDSALAVLELLLIPPDPLDDLSVIVEIRAGTGGDEAALFVADCVRMYQLYAAEKKWTLESLSATPSTLGGFREFVFEVVGKEAYKIMRHESGTHRVQRVPETEAQGRLHTSAVTIAVLVPDDPDVDIDIPDKDLKIQTCRSSGAGGQHVNKTDSAVRLTHIPSGIVCYCQEERSQNRNREKAMRLLKAKLLERKKAEKHAAVSAIRASQVGTGDRSERIRTYNFPQNRLTDHRIGLTLYSLDKVLNGDLHQVSYALLRWFSGKQIISE